MTVKDSVYHVKLKPVLVPNRPLWSVLIPTYNCAHYLRQTLASVLAQDLGPEQMEIIVVDDFSTKDDPEAVVNQYEKGRVRFIRQKKNVGKVRNYETGLQASKGRYIHQLHGDDLVCPGFYATMNQLFDHYPNAGAAFCRSIYIDSKNRWTGLTGILQDHDGILKNFLSKQYISQQVQTPAMVVKREVYETVGTFDRRLECMEDREMWTRVACNYPVAYTNRVLAKYRQHSENATALTYKNKTAFTTFKEVNTIIDSYVPENVKSLNYHKRKKEQAKFWIFSYHYIKNELSINEKFNYWIFILKEFPSINTLINLFR